MSQHKCRYCRTTHESDHRCPECGAKVEDGTSRLSFMRGVAAALGLGAPQDLTIANDHDALMADVTAVGRDLRAGMQTFRSQP